MQNIKGQEDLLHMTPSAGLRLAKAQSQTQKVKKTSVKGS